MLCDKLHFDSSLLNFSHAIYVRRKVTCSLHDNIIHFNIYTNSETLVVVVVGGGGVVVVTFFLKTLKWSWKNDASEA